VCMRACVRMYVKVCARACFIGKHTLVVGIFKQRSELLEFLRDLGRVKQRLNAEFFRKQTKTTKVWLPIKRSL
jgi:hypothetical protein